LISVCFTNKSEYRRHALYRGPSGLDLVISQLDLTLVKVQFDLTMPQTDFEVADGLILITLG
jgi:hypothetical protein